MPEAQTAAQRPGRLARELLGSSRRATSVPRGDVVPLAAGDPDFATPEHIREALAEAVAAGMTHYGEPFGDPELRAVIAGRLSAGAAERIDASRVVVTHGASGGLSAVLLACLDPGDRVVVPEPTYSLYADHVRLAGAVTVGVPPGRDGRIDVESVDRACVGARLLVICNPNNPTGTVLRRDELEAIGRVAATHDLLVLSDEAYDAIVYDGVGFVSALEVGAFAGRLLYCNTFSKRYAMTGWRVGHVAVPESLAQAVGRMHYTLHGTTNAAVQRAALAALTGPQDCVTAMVDEYAHRRSAVVSALAATDGVELRVPEGTFYAFVRYPQAIDSVAMRARALEAGVAVRAGSEFGDAGEGHVRIAFTADPASLAVGLERLRGVLTARR